MDDDWITERNETIKHYLFNTMSTEYTNRDVMVQQIIDMNDDYTDYPAALDLDRLYDMTDDEIHLRLQQIYDKMIVRKTIEERKI